EGVVEVTDYMPIDAEDKQPNEIARSVSVIRGNVCLRMRCQPRFNYAKSSHRAEITDSCAMFFPVDDISTPLALYSTVTLEQHSQDVISTFKLKAGERASFVFGAPRPAGQQPEMDLLGQRFRQTSRFWKKWIAKSKYKGRWREMVQRSALMLKLLIS